MTPRELREWIEQQPKRPTRIDVATRYRDALLDTWNRWQDYDWAPLNHLILETWSIAGLEWIKREAWKAAEKTVAMRIRDRARHPLGSIQ